MSDIVSRVETEAVKDLKNQIAQDQIKIKSKLNFFAIITMTITKSFKFVRQLTYWLKDVSFKSTFTLPWQGMDLPICCFVICEIIVKTRLA